jgi:hypothetical protein
MSKAMVLAYIDLRDGNGLRERCVMARPKTFGCLKVGETTAATTQRSHHDNPQR